MPKLLNLSQIEGGKILRNFLTAYPASQTTTKIEKKDKTLYSAEELLSELKSSMDSLLGDGSSGSSIDDRIKNSIKAINEIKLAAIITYVHPPNDHKNDANAFPTAPNMKWFTTKTVFNLLLSSLDKLNSLVWVKTDIPCTATDNMAAMITMATIES